MSNKKLNKLVLDAAEALSYNSGTAQKYLEEEGINVNEFIEKGFEEIQNFGNTEPKVELTKSQSFFRRAVLAAKIAHECHKEWAFGVVKFQKLVYLSEQVCDMKFTSNYRKQAAGPMDHKFIHSIKKEFEKQKWFNVSQQGEYKKWVFTPEVNVNGYEKYYSKYYNNVSVEIQFLIDTFKKTKTNDVELVATIYSCWNEVNQSNTIFSEEIIIQKVYAWHEKKKKFSKEEISMKIIWMKENGIHPC